MTSGRKPPRRISASYLQAVTARYLERYATTRAHLRRLLMQRVQRARAHHGEAYVRGQVTEADDGPLAAGAALVDAELTRLQELGWLDDRRFATDRARALHRRGTGIRAIRAALRNKGVPADIIDEVVAALSEGGDPDWEAALTYARKRRLGPWRQVELDVDRRRKELGKLGRAGFSWDVARRVVDLPAE